MDKYDQQLFMAKEYFSEQDKIEKLQDTKAVHRTWIWVAISAPLVATGIGTFVAIAIGLAMAHYHQKWCKDEWEEFFRRFPREKYNPYGANSFLHFQHQHSMESCTRTDD